MSKIQNEDEVRQWYEQGRTYAWMSQEYLRKYQIQIVGSAFSNMRQRRGWQRRIARDDVLIPWSLHKEHRQHYAVVMLRAEGRRRAGKTLRPTDQQRLTAWLATLAKDDLVVAYYPDSKDGFSYVPRRPNIDADLIREPDAVTTLRRNADR